MAPRYVFGTSDMKSALSCSKAPGYERNHALIPYLGKGATNSVPVSVGVHVPLILFELRLGKPQATHYRFRQKEKNKLNIGLYHLTIHND